MNARQVEAVRYSDSGRLGKVVFWNPLPIGNGLDEESTRLIRESNADITAERFDSALDYALSLNAIAPNFIPGFIRTTELLVATQRISQASQLFETISRHVALHGTADFDLPLAKVAAHIDPTTENVYEVATSILESDSTHLLIPYTPAAIEVLAEDGRVEDALDLATDWASRASGNALSSAYLVREQLRSELVHEAEITIRHLREKHDLDRLWPENVIASGVVAVAKTGSQTNWGALADGCEALRSNRIKYPRVRDLLEFLVPVLPEHERALIAAGLYALSASDTAEARALLQTVNPSNSFERYLVGIGLSRIAEIEDDKQLLESSLSDAFESLQDEKVAAFAEKSEIFSPPAPAGSVGVQLARIYRDKEAYSDALEILDRLRKAGQADGSVERLHAEIVGQSGSRTEALKELDRILTRQEAENQHRAAIQTLESMVRLLPGNLTIRSRLVDKYLRVGQFREAVDQLVLQARLLHRAGRTQDALPPMHRAIEISTMVGDWARVDQIHQLMISFDPEDTAIRHSAAATYVQHGRTGEAIEQLREIARIARERDDPDEAIAASHQMLALAPDEPSTYHQLGELLLSIEEYGQAERVYRRLAALVPDDPAITAKQSAIAAMARSRQ